MPIRFFLYFLLLGGICFCPSCQSSVTSHTATVTEEAQGAGPQVQGEVAGDVRPMIWVRPSERAAILAKIDTCPPVAKYYADFARRVADDLEEWAQGPEAYLRRLPFAPGEPGRDGHPRLKTYTSFGENVRHEQDRMMHYLHTAIDCGVLFFLTEEERYARYAGDVLNAFLYGVIDLPLDDVHNAGWIYARDHLREAREIGAQIPIIYDFIHPWLMAGGEVYHLGAHQRVPFAFPVAEQVFRTYARLVVDRGLVDCNWPVLEASSLVSNALALSDPHERQQYLDNFLVTSTARQDALPRLQSVYRQHGGDWPESIGYAQGVSSYLTYLLTLLSHHDPETDLVRQYPEITASLSRAYYLTYPGGEETILFGDGHREYRPLLQSCEYAYHLGQRTANADLVNTFGPLINHAVTEQGYERFELPAQREFGANVYREPTRLLWHAAEVPASAGDYPLPTTDELPFAGITLQRNLSPNGRPADGLMGFVGGAAYVHGHATGMSMELFGRGFVLGGKGGRLSYGTDIHENYYRIFASNNTVIVNGATTSAGGWVNLGTDRVNRLAMEPLPRKAALSPLYSFSTSAFHDTVGRGAEAYQERTLGIVRTTDSTGYYVDVFRSHSALPEQYHDYIYRNVGEQLDLTQAEGGAVPLQSDPDRFMANARATWRKNRVYRQPGWHYFTEVQTSAERTDNVKARFTARRLATEPISMQAWFPTASKRTFTTALSPPLTEGPAAYREVPAPTLIVRQPGSAWQNPFAVIYEPVSGNTGSIDRVEILRSNITGQPAVQAIDGLIVQSNARADHLTQLVLMPGDTSVIVEYPDFDLRFQGRYAVVTMDKAKKISDIYIGHGAFLSTKDYTLKPHTGRTMSVSMRPGKATPVVVTSSPVLLQKASAPPKIYGQR